MGRVGSRAERVAAVIPSIVTVEFVQIRSKKGLSDALPRDQSGVPILRANNGTFEASVAGVDVYSRQATNCMVTASRISLPPSETVDKVLHGAM